MTSCKYYKDYESGDNIRDYQHYENFEMTTIMLLMKPSNNCFYSGRIRVPPADRMEVLFPTAIDYIAVLRQPF